MGAFRAILFIYLFVYLFIYLFNCLFVYLSIYLFIGCLEDNHPFIKNYFLRLPVYVNSTPPWLLKSSSSELYPGYFIIAYFYPISLLVNKATIGTLAFTVYHLYYLQSAMPRHWSPDAFQLPS